jgi:hypothetical protein
MKERIGKFLFDSEFDSGNLGSVVYEKIIESTVLARLDKDRIKSNTILPGYQKRNSYSTLLNESSSTSFTKEVVSSLPKTPDHRFKLWTNLDGHNTDSPTKNRTWFHFSIILQNRPEISSDTKPETIVFQFMNLNRVQKLFNMGFRPLFRHEKDTRWHRIPSMPVTNYVNGSMEMTFQFTFVDKDFVKSDFESPIGTFINPAPDGKYFFAYCLPYSYENLRKNLDTLEDRITTSNRGMIKRSGLESKIPRPRENHKIVKDFYFHRDVICLSVDHHNLDIITISSNDLLSEEYETPPEGIFPDTKKKRCKKFRVINEKKFFVISSRVHPAETIASYMLDGLIEFISSDDPMAKFLRSKFIFKIIPMLNPDGVVRGNYRGGHYGLNLNRVYSDPDQLKHPTIWATKQYIKYLTDIGEVKWYIDFHGHANKLGSFLFGNWIQDVKKQHEMLKFAKYCSMNNPLFDFTECDFAPKDQLPGAEEFKGIFF